MRIGELAAKMEVSVDTLRFYEEKGLIKAGRAANGYRFYSEQTAQLVGYIKLAQQLGFSLREIGENLPLLWNSEGASTDLLAQLFEEKIALLDKRIEQLHGLRHLLAERAIEVCPLMEARPIDASSMAASGRHQTVSTGRYRPETAAPTKTSFPFPPKS